MTFLNFGITDIIDILLVAFLFYQVYMLIRGTIAINIFVGIFGTYMLWLTVKALNMQLLSSILGQVMGVGVIALLIVFQQEIRRFFLLIGSKYLSRFNFSIENIFSFMIKTEPTVKAYSIVKACVNMSKTKTGALIVISKNSNLDNYVETGQTLNALTSSNLIETIFFKNSPLHDGAVIIESDQIIAAGCVLPVSDSTNLSQHLGLRHRSALGVSETTDASVITVSEETGNVSYFKLGELIENIGINELRKILEKEFIEKEKQPSFFKKAIELINNKDDDTYQKISD